MSLPLIGVGTVTALCAATGIFTRTHFYQKRKALNALSIAYEPIRPQGLYVKRVEAEASIRDYLSSDNPRRGYLVVASPKGAGKTTVLNHVLRGRVGVLRVRLPATEATIDIMKSVAKEFGANIDFIDGSAGSFVVEVCQEFLKVHEHYPVILFDVEGDYKSDRVAAVARAIGHAQKFLTSDSAAAFAIADISAIAVAANVADPRAGFVSVPELSQVDAEGMLKSMGTGDGSVQNIGDLVHRIGGNPAILIRLAKSSSSMIATVEKSALAETKHFIRCCPEHKKALFELAKTAFDTGLERDEYEEMAMARESSSAKEVSEKFRVIHLDMQNNRVVFHTFPHFRMAQEILRNEDEGGTKSC